MEKTPMYAVVTPPHPCKRQWVAWVATGVSILALVVACVTAAVAVQQVDRVTDLEERMLEMQSHMEEILRFTISSHDYLDYEDDANDSQLGPYEELTLQRVVRKKRQANSIDESTQAAVPIYEQAYGIDLKGRSNSEGLRLYESLQATNGKGDPTSPEVTLESTDSPIKPHHRDGLLDPTGSIVFPLKEARVQEDDDDALVEVFPTPSRRRPAVLKRRSRTKSLHGTGRRVQQRKKTRVQSNSNRVPVLFRDSLVKATSRHDGYSGRNSVTPQAPQKVVQDPAQPVFVTRAVQSPVIKSDELESRKKKRPGTRQGRRRRCCRSAVTVAHFVATPFNRTSRHGATGGDTHEEWSPAGWMDKLGLNRKYPLDRGTVTVREAGLYYLYAQVLYEPGRFGTGFQVMVDGIPIMECTLAPTQPSHSCYTAGATYLPRNAEVYVRDMEHHVTTVRRQENSFFGLLKLMDAPKTAEELLLGSAADAIHSHTRRRDGWSA
ncbi:uncharacterized protein egr isoform X2 [Panulirus ornatus]|uniref:uncharacterized protein egr isoform X2 n=1 Tax=Panulirus ornatus TaxID=150431 RepID=UPI003A89FB7B